MKSHSFYINTYPNCAGSTPFCRKHCYIKTVPFKNCTNPFKNYELNDFKLQNIKKAFINAGLITFFAGGTIPIGKEAIFIQQIPSMYPDKRFCIFIRHIFALEGNIPENVSVNFSLDHTSTKEVIEFATSSSFVNYIAILDHPDNFNFMVELQKRNNFNSIFCRDCLRGGSKALCFYKSKYKALIIQDFKELT